MYIRTYRQTWTTTQEWSILYYEASIAKVDREDKIDETAELIEKVYKYFLIVKIFLYARGKCE